MTFDYGNKILSKNADGAMDIDFKDFYFDVVNQVLWETQDTKICIATSQVPLANHVECVVDEERAPTIAIDEPSNAISSSPSFGRIQHSTKGSSNVESSMFY